MLTGSTLGTALFFVVVLALIPTTIVLIRYLADRRERARSSSPATPVAANRPSEPRRRRAG